MKIAALLLAATFVIRAAFAADDEAAWTAKVAPGLRKNPAFEYVKEDPKLPRVLIIGDSISIGYTPAVRKLLAGKANVLRIPTNGSSTNEGVQKIDEWLGSGKWAVIHFNWGLHDLKHFRDGKMDDSAPVVSTPEKYESNLRTLVQRMKQTGVKLIFATTTPVPEGTVGRPPGEEKKYNEVAVRVMKEEGVQIDDLAAAVAPKINELQRPKNVHFQPAGDEFLGRTVAESIEKNLR
jgi:acyl-CoA thioesterase-1